MSDDEERLTLAEWTEIMLPRICEMVAGLVGEHAIEPLAQQIRALEQQIRAAESERKVAGVMTYVSELRLADQEKKASRKGPRGLAGGRVIEWFEAHEPSSLPLPWPDFLGRLESAVKSGRFTLPDVVTIEYAIDEVARAHADASGAGELKLDNGAHKPITVSGIRSAHARWRKQNPPTKTQ